MATGNEKQTTDPGEGPSSPKLYRVPALDIESLDRKRLSDDVPRDKQSFDDAAERDAWHDAQEQSPGNNRHDQKRADSTLLQTEVPSDSEQGPDNRLKRFRPAHFPRPYRDEQEYEIMSSRFFERQPPLNLRYRTPSSGSYGSRPFYEQRVSRATLSTETDEFHDRVCRSLLKHVADLQCNPTRKSIGYDSSLTSNGSHVRKDSKWPEGPFPSNVQSGKPTQEAEEHPQSLEDRTGESVASLLKNIPPPALESVGDHSTVRAARSQHLDKKNSGQNSTRHPYDAGPGSSSMGLVEKSTPGIARNHRPQEFRYSDIPYGRYPPSMAEARPKAVDKRSSTATGKGVAPTGLVPYGTGRTPIDLFTYNAHKPARPTFHQAPNSSHTSDALRGKKTTSKGVTTSGALGVPPKLLQKRPCDVPRTGPDTNHGERQSKDGNSSPYRLPKTNAEATPTAPPELKSKKPSSTTVKEPGGRLPPPLEGAKPLLRKEKSEKGFKNFVGRLAKKASIIGNGNGESESIFTRHPSPYPPEDVTRQKDKSLTRKISRKLTKKSHEDLQSQSHIHPALRTPTHAGTKERRRLYDNGNLALNLIPTRDSIGRSWKGKDKADC